jgi:uncharacterized coiled-coil DUF342 family protein
MVDSANETVAQLKAELADVQQEAEEARREADEYRRTAEDAEAQLRSMKQHSEEEAHR